jgi:hypothetical protein
METTLFLESFMNVFGRQAQYGLVWLSATAMLVAGLPRIGCVCLPGDCLGSSGAIASSSPACCCLATHRDSTEGKCCRTHHGQATRCALHSADLKVRLAADDVAVAGYAPCTGIPQDQILVTVWSEKEPDGRGPVGAGVPLAHSAFAESQITQRQGCAPLWAQRALPPTDLITALQRFLI